MKHSMQQQATILVTGGLGFIGSHACVELITAGYEVVIIDNLSNCCLSVLERIEKITARQPRLYQADVRDKQALEQLFNDNHIDAVMHFAGLKAVGESCEKPLLYYQNNVYGSMVLLEAMMAAQVKRIIFSSSATVYGDPDALPITEAESLKPTNPYGHSKLVVENLLKAMCQADADFSATVLRYFNPVGAHASGLIGEDPNDIPNNLVPYIVKVANGELPCLNIFGNDYETADGTGVRDYIHVVDLVQGHLNALRLLLAQQSSAWNVYNLGTGQGSSVLDVKQAFEQVTQVNIPTEYTARRAGDIASCFAAAEKANKELAWKAQLSLEQMLIDAWRFNQHSKQQMLAEKNG